jgi:DNA (cytosine-5)-methyltransferase 1
MTPRAYYNEIDPHAAQWLRNLIAAGHIPAGDVDERNINDVRPSDLAGYIQYHFFAGIGGWTYALRLAGWPEDRPVWTGSCPCQPFSVAGTGAGFADERHLWPAWFHLIEQCRPVVIFGEQVEAAIRHDWLDLVHADLEGAGYTVGAACLPAASVGAPHQRQRLWFVAQSDGPDVGRQEAYGESGTRGEIRGLAHAHMPEHNGRHASGGEQSVHNERDVRPCAFCGYEFDHDALGKYGCPNCEGDGLAHSEREGSQGGIRGREDTERADQYGCSGRGGSTRPWSDLEWLPCTDGKTRPTRPGLFPLAHGVSGRMGRLRAYGNAIVPQVAAEFIAAYLGAST